MTARHKLRVSAMQTLDKLVDNTSEKIRLLGQMRRSLVSTFIKEDGMKFTDIEFFALLRAYHKAVEAKQDTFVFEGHELLTTYAHYLLEYLQSALPLDGKDHMLIGNLKREHARRMEKKS